MKSHWLIAGCVLALWLVGCAPNWKVLSQADPNPLAGKKTFVLMPIDYADLHVGRKTEEEYLSEKRDKSTASFQQDKADMDEKFSRKLQAVAGTGGINVLFSGEQKSYVIKPHIGFMEPGYNAVISKKASKVVLTLRIEDPQGKLVDEVQFEHRTSKGFAAGSRYRSDAENIGRYAGEYLKTRVMPN